MYNSGGDSDDSKQSTESSSYRAAAAHNLVHYSAAVALVSLPTRRAIVARDSKKSLNAVKYLDMELRP